MCVKENCGTADVLMVRPHLSPSLSLPHTHTHTHSPHLSRVPHDAYSRLLGSQNNKGALQQSAMDCKSVSLCFLSIYPSGVPLPHLSPLAFALRSPSSPFSLFLFSPFPPPLSLWFLTRSPRPRTTRRPPQTSPTAALMTCRAHCWRQSACGKRRCFSMTISLRRSLPTCTLSAACASSTFTTTTSRACRPALRASQSYA